MSGSIDPPRPRGCCCRCCPALRKAKVAKGLVLHVAIVATLFNLIFYGLQDNYSFRAKIAFESVSFPAIACLYIYSSSSWKEKIISGIFLGVLAVVSVIAALNAKSRAPLPMFICNLLALLPYCVWRFWAIVQACLRRRRVRSAAAAATAAPAPLLPVHQEEEAGCSPVQRAAFRIEELPREFSHEEIRAVTGDFGSLVGRGGSAEVFRGVLDDGTAVAVKRIISDRAVGEADFLREISIVANVHHRSLVRLLGYCLPRGGASGGQYYLVYTFFEHGSLDWWLFHGEERRRLLPWPTRRRVAVDVARALAYLHHECHRQVLHLDIKPANILLDGGLRAHVSDFGISMSVACDLTSVYTCGRGTPGYMAPEIWAASALSAKSDVYSYGVTLLELVGGRRCFEHGSVFFPSVVWEKMARGELMEVADAAMARVEEGEVETVVKVALCCIQPRRETRPSMLTVVDMLEGRVAVDLLPESRLSTVNFAGRSPADSRRRT